MSLYFVQAFLLGAAAALSLPLGAAVGLGLKPRHGVVGLAAAVGGGALVALATVVMMAPALGEANGAEGGFVFLVLVLGAMAGGGVLVAFDHVLSASGGFLRRAASTVAFFTSRKRQRIERLLHALSRIELIRSIPPEEMQHLLELVRPMHLAPGDVLCREGESGDRLFFIYNGQVDLIQHGAFFKTLGPGSVLGEISLLTGGPRTAAATAVGYVTALTALVLVNFSEGLTGAAALRANGWRGSWIMVALGTGVITTGLAAGGGYLLGASLPPLFVIGMNGVVAGAVLTVAAAAVLPEAVYLASAPAVGLATLAGFLGAFAFQPLQ